ncbi:hypothetical protein AMK59_2663 [Oryctes borbonicus]|uniref:Insect pheromone-binding family n=1 Tax=Oryctes borbonicus TaxID=1629725 RepID=A0A0T6BCP4_9SCAR|nr:hypothetical protein AMK59_2663 [Oryctes borbonicus]
MKSFLLLLVLSVIAIAIAEEKYTTKYDNINIQEILNNKRLLKGYTNCLLEKGPCAPDAAELKRVLPDALQTNCSKCSEKQRTGAREILTHLINNEPEIWNELEEKYDPDGIYRGQYKELANKDGIPN